MRLQLKVYKKVRLITHKNYKYKSLISLFINKPIEIL